MQNNSDFPYLNVALQFLNTVIASLPAVVCCSVLRRSELGRPRFGITAHRNIPRWSLVSRLYCDSNAHDCTVRHPRPQSVIPSIHHSVNPSFPQSTNPLNPSLLSNPSFPQSIIPSTFTSFQSFIPSTITSFPTVIPSIHHALNPSPFSKPSIPQSIIPSINHLFPTIIPSIHHSLNHHRLNRHPLNPSPAITPSTTSIPKKMLSLSFHLLFFLHADDFI